MSEQHKNVSKFLSLVLRHRPDQIGIELDANGWVSVAELIEKSKRASQSLSSELIQEIVRTSDKQRFALSDDGKMIRANQRHSVAVDLALLPEEPPIFLFHGTATRFIESIKKEGLKPMGRQHVHLSVDSVTATRVGQRHGKPVILKIRAGDLWASGHTFFVSDNGVWLTDALSPQWIEFPD
jgi:putative RNA 2'-phosphotransferase